MKQLIVIILSISSFVTFGQTLDTLKFPADAAKTMADLNQELKDLEPARIRRESILKQQESLIKLWLDANKIPYEQFKGAIAEGILVDKKSKPVQPTAKK